MASVAEWRTELEESADRLEAGAARWALAKEARDEFDRISDVAGLLRSDAPWAALPHAEVVMDIARQLRRVAADLAEVPEPPEMGDDDA